MSGRQFTEWQIYESLEPFGERGHYWRMGQLCATMANVNRAKKSDKVYTAEDFMPTTFQPEPDEDVVPPDEFARLKALQASVRRTP